MGDMSHQRTNRKKGGGNYLFNDALNTFYLRLYGIGHMVNDHIYYKRGNPLSLPLAYSFRLAERDLLNAPSHRQDRTYHHLCYTGWNEK